MKHDFTRHQICLLQRLLDAKMSQSQFTKKFWRLSQREKKTILQPLINKKFIDKRMAQNPRANKPTTFYALTKKGKAFVSKYNEQFDSE